MRIRITSPGIYGAKGEVPVGTELEVERAPDGWAGRYQVVSEGPSEDAELITNDDDEKIEAARREVAEAAQKHIDGLKASHADELKAVTERAEKAEGEVAELQSRVAELEKAAAERGHDPELIKAAVDGLDPANDEHWTQAGLPEVAAVKEALGAEVTRKQIEAAAPDAKRPTK